LQPGALDDVAKPFHLDEVRARVMQALDKRRLILENRMYQEQLEQRVQEQARRIEELSLERLQALVHALEEKDPYLRGHSVRVANYAFGIGRELGLATAALDLISMGAELHEHGKIGVSEAVLHKPGKLTDVEYRHIMEHTVTGARILGPLMRDAPVALAIVRSHHERLDGKGFPDGLKGDEIPLEVRIVTVADSFDAMTSLRPYRPELSVANAMDQLEEGHGRQFGQGAGQAFLRAFPDAASLPDPSPAVVVGRDARPSGPEFAQAAIAALRRAGCDVIDVGLVPTPTVQLAVEHHHAGGGIAITASHNPIEWNALKFIGPDGIFLDGDAGTRVRALAENDTGTGRGRGNPKGLPGGRGERGRVSADPAAIERHLEGVLQLAVVDVERLRARRFTVALDAVRGAGGAIMPAVLERLGCRVVGVNLETDGRFPRPPEPVPENLGELAALVRGSGAHVGIAVDPDVDRLAIVDESGTPIGEDYTLPFAGRAVLEPGRGEGGRGRGSAVVR